jgi:hypothetical protein
MTKPADKGARTVYVRTPNRTPKGKLKHATGSHGHDARLRLLA